MADAVLLLAAFLCAPAAFAQAVSPPVENLTSFDYRLAELRWQGNRWQLWAGDVWLKDFGKRESEGREVVRIVRELHLTQRGTVGTPQPILEYWLADGQAPHGPSPSSRAIAFEPAHLRVDPFQGQWCLRDLRYIAFVFQHETEARRALAILRHYGFDVVGYVGQSPTVMMYFLDSQSSHVQKALPNSTESHTPATAIAPLKASSTTGLHQSHSSQSERTERSSAITPASLPSGRQLTAVHAPLPGQVVIGERVSFDWRLVQIRKDDRDWKLVSSGNTLANLGPNEGDARQALSAVQHYRFTEQYVIGGPTPSFTYFLVNGQEPRSLNLGVNNVAFEWALLSVQQVDGTVAISDGNRALFHFGDKADDANLALKAIQHYQFDHLCHIGPPSPSGMTYLVRTHFKKTNRGAPSIPADSLPLNGPHH